MKKLEAKRYGPFPIIAKKGRSAYQLKLPPSWRIHPMFNEALISPYQPPSFPKQQLIDNPPPEIVNDQEEYKIEKIVEHRHKNTKTRIEYLVHWKGYPQEERTWLKEKDLENAQEVVQEYWEGIGSHKEIKKKQRRRTFISLSTLLNNIL
jgi:hypothetical protein